MKTLTVLASAGLLSALVTITGWIDQSEQEQGDPDQQMWADQPPVTNEPKVWYAFYEK